MRKIAMPRLDIDMESGTVVEWMMSEKQPVKQGELLVKITSLKVTVEVPSPVSGILGRIIVPAGLEVPVGQVMCILMEEGDSPEELETAVREAEARLSKEKTTGRAEAHVVTKMLRRDVERVIASPLAKRLAEEHGLDLHGVVGSGPEGRIIKEDVLRLVEETSQFSETIPLTGIRKIVAERMAESFRTVPHATVVIEIDMSRVVEARERLKKEGTEVSYNAFFIRAAAKALKEFPILNSTLQGEAIKVWRRINICLATDTPSGLVAPVVKDADRLSLPELTKTAGGLAIKARENRLTIEDLKGGTFTITSLGMFDVSQFQPIINPPQAAILAIGSISRKPVAEGESVVIKPTVVMSLSFDHRILDGAPAAKFLRSLRELLQNPD